MNYAWFVMKLCAIAALAFVIFNLSDSPFLMIGGSDATSFLVGPTLAVQVICVVSCAILILAPGSMRARLICMAIAMTLTLVGTHRLVIDNNRGEVRDIYLLMPLQTLRLVPSADYGASAIVDAAGFRVGQSGNSAWIWCLSPPLIGLDRKALLAAAGPMKELDPQNSLAPAGPTTAH